MRSNIAVYVGALTIMAHSLTPEILNGKFEVLHDFLKTSATPISGGVGGNRGNSSLRTTGGEESNVPSEWGAMRSGGALVVEATLFMASSVPRPVCQHGPAERMLLHEQP